MSLRSLLPEAVENYVSTVATRETALQKRLRDETATMTGAGMQIGADEGALLALLVRLIGAQRALEIGTYTGYSSLAVAMALPANGKLVCCDINDEWTQVARRYWREAGLADKEGYDGYYESCIKLVRTGGLMAFDNTLWSGRVADASHKDKDTVALRNLNAKVRDDPRVDACLLTVGDGVLLARKR